MLFAVASLLVTANVHAEVVTFVGEGRYFLTTETVDFAKNQAELLAERDALERVSVYVQSDSTMKDNMLENDEIITISAGILHVTDTDFQFAQDDASGGIWVKAIVTANIDIDELEELLKQAVKNRGGSDL